jgi:hypothetical protein
MRKKILILLSSAIFILLSNVYSQDDRWLYVGSNDNVSVYYDNETVKRSENSTIVLLKFINANDGKNQYIIYKIEFYCNKDQYKLITVTVYPFEGTPYIYKYNEIKDLIPESFEEAAYKMFYGTIDSQK